MTAIFNVPDMTCGHCEKTVRGALAGVLPGADVTVDLAMHQVTIASDAPGNAAGDAALAEQAIREAGYSPERVVG